MAHWQEFCANTNKPISKWDYSICLSFTSERLARLCLSASLFQILKSLWECRLFWEIYVLFSFFMSIKMAPLRTTQIISKNINYGNTNFRNIKNIPTRKSCFQSDIWGYMRVVNVEVTDTCMRMIMIKFEYKAGKTLSCWMRANCLKMGICT